MLSVCRSLRRLLAGSTVAAAILRLAEQQKLKLDATRRVGHTCSCTGSSTSSSKCHGTSGASE